jgi:hypothetical protein
MLLLQYSLLESSVKRIMTKQQQITTPFGYRPTFHSHFLSSPELLYFFASSSESPKMENTGDLSNIGIREAQAEPRVFITDVDDEKWHQYIYREYLIRCGAQSAREF